MSAKADPDTHGGNGGYRQVRAALVDSEGGAAAAAVGGERREEHVSATQPQKATILLVEDDPAVSTMLRDRLQAGGYAVWRAENAAEGEIMADALQPDLIILDLMPPDRHGLVLCAELRERHAAPIIICSATKPEHEPVLGLKLGAVDFIRKPFAADELEARVEAALRRAGAEREGARPPEAPLRLGPLMVDQARWRATLGGEALPLTATEYRLLCLLVARPDAVLSREELAEAVWGAYDDGIGRSLEVHVRRLRAKLNRGPVPAPALVTVRGFGYRLAPQPDEGSASSDLPTSRGGK
jgi:DNA-binding response OmpR family regulator